DLARDRRLPRRRARLYPATPRPRALRRRGARRADRRRPSDLSRSTGAELLGEQGVNGLAGRLPCERPRRKLLIKAARGRTKGDPMNLTERVALITGA